MGGSSSKVTVGYKYSLGMHLVWHLGMADRCLRIQVDKRTAWEGSSTGGRIDINAPKLFGGEKKEGGVAGAVDFETGGPAQPVNDYLAAKLGALIPAFRGVTATVLRQVYLGLNPYLKPWSGRFQRIHLRHEGAPQWYDAKAEIVTPSDYLAPWLTAFPYENGANAHAVVAEGETYASLAEMQTAWAAAHPGFTLSLNARRVTVTSPGGGVGASEYSAQMADKYHKSYDPVGTQVTLQLVAHWRTNESGLVFSKQDEGITDNNAVANILIERGWEFGKTAEIRYLGGEMYPSVLTSGATSSPPPAPPGYAWSEQSESPMETTLGPARLWGADYIDVSMTRMPRGYSDMNPAHIVRECLTDLDWGMGYADADIDDTAFTAAADTLYDEGFGLSTLWSRQSKLEEFIREILRHINAVLYVDRTTGKFVLNLIRDDYDPETLLVLNEDNIDKIENLSRPALGEMVNSVSVVYWSYNTSKDASLTVQDIALIQQQGCIINTTVQYPAVTNGALAARLAQRDLRTLSYPLLTVTLTATRAAAVLNVGRPFRLQWPDMGVEDVVMRVTEISPGDGKSRKVRITAVQDVFGLPAQSFVTPVDEPWEPPVSAPQPSPARLVIEAPYLELVQRQGQTSVDAELAAVPEAGYILVAAQSPSSDAINATLAVDSGAGYEESATLDFCPSATLSEVLERDATTVAIGGILSAEEIEDVAIGSLAHLGEELVRIDALSTTSVTLGRGCLDTVPEKHLVGSRLWFIDLFADGDEVQYVDGESLNVKVLPSTGQGELDIADAPADTVTMDQRAIRPYPPADVRLNGDTFPAMVTAPAEVTWATRNRVQQTSGTLLDWFDGAVTPEAGQSTTIRLLQGATILETWAGETDGTVTLATDVTGIYTLEATSQRDGYDSFQTFSHDFVLIGSDALLTESGEPLETEDAAILTE